MAAGVNTESNILESPCLDSSEGVTGRTLSVSANSVCRVSGFLFEVFSFYVCIKYFIQKKKKTLQGSLSFMGLANSVSFARPRKFLKV